MDNLDVTKFYEPITRYLAGTRYPRHVPRPTDEDGERNYRRFKADSLIGRRLLNPVVHRVFPSLVITVITFQSL